MGFLGRLAIELIHSLPSRVLINIYVMLCYGQKPVGAFSVLRSNRPVVRRQNAPAISVLVHCAIFIVS